MAFGLALLGEQSDFPGEVCWVVEDLVHAGKAQVGHLIELSEPFEHLAADALARNDFEPIGTNALLDLGHQCVHGIVADRTVLARRANTCGHLLRIERNPVPRALLDEKDDFFESLEGGEAATTLEALTTSTDCLAVFHGARVDDLVVVTGTRGALHAANGSRRLGVPPISARSSCRCDTTRDGVLVVDQGKVEAMESRSPASSGPGP